MSKAARALFRLGLKYDSTHTIICIPHAGAGATAFGPWASAFPGIATVWAACMPGRERRAGEELLTTIPEMADSLVAPAKEVASGNILLFGHCSGALVAFELARRLEAQIGESMLQLVISSQPLPSARKADELREPTEIDPDELVALLKEMNGTSQEFFESHEFVEALMPAIRADLTAVKNYTYPIDSAPLKTPICVFGGIHDEHINLARLKAWESATVGAFEISLFNSGHFYLFEEQERVVEKLSSLITKVR